jgi:hypothetical protein
MIAVLSESAATLRREIIDTLRATAPTRAGIIRRGSADSELDLERAFRCTCEVGEFNRIHPAHKIDPFDLDDKLPAFPVSA